MLEEIFCGAVEERATWDFGAASDFDEAPVEEHLHDSVDGDPANGFAVCAGDGLSVSDDGEGFELGTGETGGFGFGIELADPEGAGGVTDERPPVDAFDEVIRAGGGDELGLDLGEGGEEIGGFGIGESFGFLIFGKESGGPEGSGEFFGSDWFR